MRRFLLLALALFLLGGCGYRFGWDGASRPEGLETVYVDMFANRSTEPFLENTVTNRVVEQFSRRGGWRLSEDAKAADAVLSGTVQSYTTLPISYDALDEITEYRSEVTINAVMRRGRDGKVLWKGKVAWSEEYPAADDKALQEDNEATATALAAERIAEELYFRVVNRF
ncbi:MAG: molecular chaperone [Desulfuromonas sp.]|uniref:LptE family protein n=1 Tax=Desulfuromonas sp. TaxID=892 RepID=UPI000CBAC5AC|nr:LptE family protein [Desulfuromonas sp.]PLX82566.1 MAG: molecular chaperone [Desulfuromonas sp.]